MRPRDDEIQEEIAAHLRLAIADRMARGASREEAERAARAEFGNVTHVAEVTREVQRGPGMIMGWIFGASDAGTGSLLMTMVREAVSALSASSRLFCCAMRHWM